MLKLSCYGNEREIVYRIDANNILKKNKSQIKFYRAVLHRLEGMSWQTFGCMALTIEFNRKLKLFNIMFYDMEEVAVHKQEIFLPMYKHFYDDTNFLVLGIETETILLEFLTDEEALEFRDLLYRVYDDLSFFYFWTVPVSKLEMQSKTKEKKSGLSKFLKFLKLKSFSKKDKDDSKKSIENQSVCDFRSQQRPLCESSVKRNESNLSINKMSLSTTDNQNSNKYNTLRGKQMTSSLQPGIRNNIKRSTSHLQLRNTNQSSSIAPTKKDKEVEERDKLSSRNDNNTNVDQMTSSLQSSARSNMKRNTSHSQLRKNFPSSSNISTKKGEEVEEQDKLTSKHDELKEDQFNSLNIQNTGSLRGVKVPSRPPMPMKSKPAYSKTVLNESNDSQMVANEIELGEEVEEQDKLTSKHDKLKEDQFNSLNIQNTGSLRGLKVPSRPPMPMKSKPVYSKTVQNESNDSQMTYDKSNAEEISMPSSALNNLKNDCSKETSQRQSSNKPNNFLDELKNAKRNIRSKQPNTTSNTSGEANSEITLSSNPLPEDNNIMVNVSQTLADQRKDLMESIRNAKLIPKKQAIPKTSSTPVIQNNMIALSMDKKIDEIYNSRAQERCESDEDWIN